MVSCLLLCLVSDAGQIILFGVVGNKNKNNKMEEITFSGCRVYLISKTVKAKRRRSAEYWETSYRRLLVRS